MLWRIKVKKKAYLTLILVFRVGLNIKIVFNVVMCHLALKLERFGGWAFIIYWVVDFL
jgi:hypothetical protein